jgi:2-desacetyl-2-hydroxyethyl bacteriochlorophyllide A dehydrogenase
MNTLVCTAPGQLDYIAGEMPQLQDGFSLLKIKRIGICGTDLHAYEGTQPYFNYPRILGHELSAEFIAGDAEGFEPGEAVTIIPYFNCGHCIACRMGKTNCCVNLQVCGVHRHGGMVEYLLVPSYAVLHGEGLSYEELALVEPLAIGAHGIRRAGVQAGEYVLVMGAGPIGLGLMEFARIRGAQVIAMDINDKRLSFCKENLGVQHTINPSSEDVVQQLVQMTNGDMPTVVIDATGNGAAINNGFNYMAHGGRYVLVGLQKKEISFLHPEFHKREGTLMSSRNATKEDFEWVMDCMKKGLVKPATYITHTVTFPQAKDAFTNWLNPEYGTIKAMINMDA